ncbi:hypothetical protein GDO78_019560 [Eleutherodactylus coqui]|uniref:Uncharacterized protein n=1 Tax=Eleutherodactylus coqui TaxID=57060 RepID=A0A8J6E957_ELECQ|nr:hypothetical protein GDO78_019560 [Eleutherodactylus coqui]
MISSLRSSIEGLTSSLASISTSRESRRSSLSNSTFCNRATGSAMPHSSTIGPIFPDSASCCLRKRLVSSGREIFCSLLYRSSFMAFCRQVNCLFSSLKRPVTFSLRWLTFCLA